MAAAWAGASDLFPNCEPTAPSKNPGEAGLADVGFLGAAFAGASALCANCAPTAPSKKPFEVPAAQLSTAQCHTSQL